MAEDIQLKTFTVLDLKEYFIHNRPVGLLSEKVINQTRAYATIMNPYVTDSMVVVSALFVDGEIAAYTYVFPDRLVRPDRLIYWNTVLYVDKKFEGRGYGFIVIGQMVEIYGDDYFDLDAVEASVENLKYAGLQVDYVEQYNLVQKKINKESFRGKLAFFVERCRQMHVSRRRYLERKILKADYSLSYSRFMDDGTFGFIRQNSEGDLFLRSQDTFNWILAHSFGEETPLLNRVSDSCVFASSNEVFHFYLVSVLKNGNVIGVYLMKRTAGGLYLNYLYFSKEYRNEVFLSVAEHILKFQPGSFFTANEELALFIEKHKLFAHKLVYRKAFSHPLSFAFESGNNLIQAGDGDNIA